MSRIIVFPLGLLFATHLNASPIALNTGFDNTPFISSRAAALGQCLSTSANGLDALYYNPALIGDFYEKAEKPLITHLFFPYIGSSSGDGGNKVMNDRLTGEPLSSDKLAKELKPSSDSIRPYARLSLTPLALFKRVLVGYTYNERIASYRNNEDPSKPSLHVDERTMSGPFIGFSEAAAKNEFYMGVSAAFLKTTQTIAEWDEATATTEAARKAAVLNGRRSYEGMPIHLGMLYRFSHFLKPTVSLVINDVGSTRYTPSDKTLSTEVTQERETLGLSISPSIKNWGTLHLTAEATDLAQASVPTRDKFRVSSELTFGDRHGADSGVGIRLGYNAAGLSYGTGINLGILSAQIASFAEDIGAGSARVIERRSVINVGINIADY
ncbi:MAG: hypothetical protein H7249_19625 [Chitinophagaceae bacterium]|nr:hypothetical protein [Oligoflexus sp.]